MNNENQYLEPNKTSLKKDRIDRKQIVKIALLAIAAATIFYLIFYSVQYGKVNFILSNTEITSDNDDQVEKFKHDDKTYFYINKRNRNIDSELFTIDIEFYENDNYKFYKRISYQLDKDFPKLSSIIPSEYFFKAGKYRIKASLDGEVVSEKNIEVSK